MKKSTCLPVLFSLVMLAFVLFMVWYVPTSAKQSFTLADLELSLDTSRGRERKQQVEYDAVVEELPLVRAELEAIQPDVEEALRIKEDLKAEKKALKAEKKKLEEAAGQAVPSSQAAEESINE